MTPIPSLIGLSRPAPGAAGRETSPRPASRLARFLDSLASPPGNSSEPGPIANVLAQASGLRQAVQRLPISQRRLEQVFGAAGLNELLALGEEEDSQLFTESLLAFGMRQEARGRSELAARIYEFLPTAGAVGERVRGRLDALAGRGAIGARVEVLLSHFIQEVTDPCSLVAMTAGGAFFRVTGFATLSRLLAGATGNPLTRGWGARALAGLAGFAVEAPAFTLSGHLMAAALGRNPDLSLQALRRDLASSFLTLGGLRLAGSLGTGLYRRFGGSSGPAQFLFGQGSTLAGIMGGHWLEEQAGLRPRLPGATVLVDSLVTLLRFHVAGNLSRQAFGPRMASWERSLDIQTERLSRENGSAPRLRPPRFPLEPMLALAGVRWPAGSSRATEASHPRGLQIFATKLDETAAPNGGGSPAAPRSEAEGRANPEILLQDATAALLASGQAPEAGMQAFLDRLPFAATAVRLERGNREFGRILQMNQNFGRDFGYSLEEASRPFLGHFFRNESLPWIGAKIFSGLGQGVFRPMKTAFLHRDGTFLPVWLSFAFKDVEIVSANGNRRTDTIAFGFYDLQNGEPGRELPSRPAASSATAERLSPPNIVDGILEMNSMLDLNIQLTREDSTLLEQALQRDLTVRTRMLKHQSPKTLAAPVLRHFNTGVQGLDFPEGRSIRMEFWSGEAECSFSIAKFGDRFRMTGFSEMTPDPSQSRRKEAAPAPNATSPSLATETNGAEVLARLQRELGTGIDRIRDRLEWEDVEVTLTGNYERNFLTQNSETIQAELQTQTHHRTHVPFGRRITLLVPAAEGPPIRLVFKKVLLRFERVEA